MDRLPGVVKGAAINLGGNLAGRALAVVYTVLITRVLDTAEVGLYYIGLTFFQILTALSVLGLDSGILRYVPIYRTRGDRERMNGVVRLALTLSLPMAAALALLLLFGSGPVARRLFHQPALAPVLLVMAPGIPFFVAGTIFLAATQALQRMEFQVYVRQVAEPAIRFGLTLLLLLAGLRLYGVVASFTVSCVVGAVMAQRYQHRLFPGSGSKTLLEDWRPILSFSLPEIFSRFLFLVFVGTDTLLLGYLSTPEQVGLYSVASRTVFVGTMFMEAFSIMFIPMISAYFEQRDLPGLESAFQTVTKWSLTLSLPIFAGLALLHREVLGVYGDAYQAGGVCMILLCLGYVFQAASGPAGSLVTMSGRSWLTLVNTLSVVALNALLNGLLIPRQGIEGAALATAISMVTLNVVRLAQVRALLGVRPYRLTVLKPLLAGGVACAAVWVAGPWIARLPILLGLVIGGALLVAIYLSVLPALRFDPEDRFILRRLRSRLTAMRG